MVSKTRKVNPSDIFQCRQCGDCCKGYGGTYITDDDIKAIAAYIKTEPGKFIAEYCLLSGTKYILGQKEDGYCVFWDKLCLIHPVKPKMCRAWPFIKSVLVDPKNWEIMADSCPGINTDVPDSVLEECVKNELARLNASRVIK